MASEVKDLQAFINPDFGKIRSIEIDGEIWFVGRDIADSLGYVNTRKALKIHVDEEDKQNFNLSSVTNRSGTDGNPNVVIINESGLYSLMLRSKLPAAHKFKRWVTSEVLPSIRKSGKYSPDKIANDPMNVMALNSAADFADILTNRFNVHKDISKAIALNRAEKSYNIDLTDVKRYLPATENHSIYLTPTEIGANLKIFSAKQINYFLLIFGYQVKIDSTNKYQATDKGKPYSSTFAFCNANNDFSGFALRWKADFLPILKNDLIKGGYLNGEIS